VTNDEMPQRKKQVAGMSKLPLQARRNWQGGRDSILDHSGSL